MGDLEILSNIQRELDCDILVSGYTHQLSVNTKENKLYINPGSLTGALSPLIEDSVPSFILMALQGEEATIYSYVLNDKSKKFEVGQIEYFRGSDELKIVKSIGEDNINKGDKEYNENNEKKDNEEKNLLEEEKKEEKIEENNLIKENSPNLIIQNENNEIKEDENKDEKIDE